ncbi:hypothetical protein KSP35_20200 [Aquihabitans sp. G128]|uniref:hypothetical protein n=1 Tax=Aquihabitans sp. G128 TaxID=2849779 RepID=UPI001C241EBE|nr:hypothetical protein [Aquihabitans sp. G128]QXC60617.1 hypothetical protein KSP35_20200 [Aquihabitans sp. G128]
MRDDGWKRQIHTQDNSLWVCDEVELALTRVRDDLAQISQPQLEAPTPSPPELGGIA